MKFEILLLTGNFDENQNRIQHLSASSKVKAYALGTLGKFLLLSLLNFCFLFVYFIVFINYFESNLVMIIMKMLRQGKLFSRGSAVMNEGPDYITMILSKEGNNRRMYKIR